MIDPRTGWTIVSKATAGYNDLTISGSKLKTVKLKNGFLITSFLENNGMVFELKISRDIKKNVIIVESYLQNNSNRSHSVVNVSPFLLSCELGGSLVLSRPSFYCNGFHSWDESRVYQLKDGSVLKSYWFSTIEDGSGMFSLLLGFVSFKKALSTIDIFYENGCEELRASFQGVVIHPGEKIKGEKMIVAVSGGGREALELWADIAGEEMCARKSKNVYTGWCSWYHAFQNIDEKYITENIRKAGELKCFQYFQIDDGYQENEGNWLKTNNKFPVGMQDIMKQIKSAGMICGLWVSPFMVSQESDIYKNHKDWLVKDLEGKGPMMYLLWRDKPVFGIDCSNPEVQKWLFNLFETFSREWGVELFKLDFLYLASLPGKRYEENFTGIMAYRKGLEIIRKAVKDRFIIGCGAPLGPSIGIVDAMRISGDVAPNWKGELSVTTSVMNTMMRYFTHKRLWINDPDCVIVRDTDTELSVNEIETLVTITGLSGGLTVMSDNLTTLSVERISLFKKITPSYGKCAVPVNLFSKGFPDIFDLRIEKPYGIWHIVCLINMDDQEKNMNFQLSKLGMGRKNYLVYDFWRDRFIGICEGELRFRNIPPHSTRLLCVRVIHGHPQLLSTNLHITQGAVEIDSMEWQKNDNTLYVRIGSKLSPGEGLLLFYVPSGYQMIDASCSAENWGSDFRHDGLLSIKVRFSRAFELRVTFQETL